MGNQSLYRALYRALYMAPNKTWIMKIFTVMGLVVMCACNSQTFTKPTESTEFGQKVTYNNQVDVLFLIETKGGMSAMQQQLGSQMPAFVEALNKTGLDYQIAVTTMDMSSSGERGRFMGNPSIVKMNTPNLGQILKDRMYIGDYDWQPMTRALEAAKNGLSGSNASSGPNAGFLRPNALLVLIFLSNRDDRSATMDYKAWFDQIRPPLPYGDRSWVAQFLGVLPDDPNCKSSNNSTYAEPGVNFIEIARASGGAVESVCSGDLRSALVNVRKRVLEKLTTFPIGVKIYPQTLKVFVNGRVIPKSDTNGWTYDEVNNVIRFHGSEVPDVNAVVHVDFDRVGLKQ